MLNICVYIQNELFKFLKRKEDELAGIRGTDRFDNFGNFVASELRSKNPEIAETYMQQICHVIFSDFTVTAVSNST